FDENLTGPEDWDLSEAAAKLGPLARTTAGILHDEGTLSYLDACRKKAYYAEGLRRYVAKRGLGTPPGAANRRWLRQPRALLNRHGGGLLALKVGESVVAVTSLILSSNSRPSRQQTDRTAAEAAGASNPLDPAPSQVRGSPPLWAALSHRIQRLSMGLVWSVRICQTMRDGPRTIFRLSMTILMPQRTDDITFLTRDGLTITAPAEHEHGYEWWPVCEVLVQDCYRVNSLARQLPSHANVIDIGAHIGTFSTLVGKLIPQAHIFAFEPSPSRASYLRHNLDINGLSDRATVVEMAVSGTGGIGRLAGSVVLVGAGTDEESTVQMVAFENVMSGIGGTIHLAKIDCEGGEYDIIEAATDATLGRIERLLLEYHPASRSRVLHLFSRLSNVGLVERWREDSIPGQLGVVYFDRSGS
ncbi:MAG: FkbM family methyltransferase, partial [Actinomycetota bacterium]|nr:FkbM family methyltransferase [Actinomycetota bacterium]